MKTVTVTELRRDIYNILEEVLQTGVPLVVNKSGRALRIEPLTAVDKFANLVCQPEVIVGDPDDLVAIEWEFDIALP